MQIGIKKFIILQVFMFFMIGETAPQCVFHKLYDDNFQYDFGTTVIESKENGFFCGGEYSDTDSLNSPYGGMYLIKVNYCGDLIWSKELDYTVPNGAFYPKNLLQLQDSTYVMCGVIADTSEGASDGFLFAVSQTGDSLWYKQIDVGYNDRAIMHKQTSDGGFIIGGYRNVIEDSSLFLIKTDSVGNVEWIQYYGVPTFELLQSIDIAKDGGYVLMGDFDNGTYDLFLIKTDSLGNQQWRKNYNSSPGIHDGGGYGIATLNGGFILVGGKEKTSGGNTEAWIVKTDSAGIKEWDKEYNLPYDTYYFLNIQQLSDSNYIISGNTADNSRPITGPMAWLIKLNTKGDTIWTKEFSYYGDNTDEYPEDLKLTNDKGFIMTGYIINNSLPQKNDLLLLKTDSLGNTCIIDSTNQATGCSTIVSIPEVQLLNTENIKIFPNPATGSVTVQLEKQYEEVEALIYDLNGSLHEEYFAKYTDEFTFPTHTLEAGSYVIQLNSKGKIIATGKMIVVQK